MKKLFVLLIFLSHLTNMAKSQSFDLDFYKHIKEFYSLIGVKIDATSKKELEENIVIRELVKDLNTNQISIYSFCSDGNDVPFNLIIIENDSIEIYEIQEINPIIRRVLNLSKKYDDICDNRKDIKWIDKILTIHLQTLNESIFNCCVMEVKRGKYTYNIRQESLKQ